MQYRLRDLIKSKHQILRGLTVPESIATFFDGCFFNVAKSGTCIVFYSGCSIYPTKKEVENYSFEDCRIS